MAPSPLGKWEIAEFFVLLRPPLFLRGKNQNISAFSGFYSGLWKNPEKKNSKIGEVLACKKAARARNDVERGAGVGVGVSAWACGE